MYLNLKIKIMRNLLNDNGFDLSMQVQTLIIKLIDKNPDLLNELEEITEWNELVKIAVDF